MCHRFYFTSMPPPHLDFLLILLSSQLPHFSESHSFSEYPTPPVFEMAINFPSPFWVVKNILTHLEQQLIWVRCPDALIWFLFCCWSFIQRGSGAGSQSATRWRQKAEGVLESCLHFSPPVRPKQEIQKVWDVFILYCRSKVEILYAYI